jgi:hypothetical protein
VDQAKTTFLLRVKQFVNNAPVLLNCVNLTTYDVESPMALELGPVFDKDGDSVEIKGYFNPAAFSFNNNTQVLSVR